MRVLVVGKWASAITPGLHASWIWRFPFSSCFLCRFTSSSSSADTEARPAERSDRSNATRRRRASVFDWQVYPGCAVCVRVDGFWWSLSALCFQHENNKSIGWFLTIVNCRCHGSVLPPARPRVGTIETLCCLLVLAVCRTAATQSASRSDLTRTDTQVGSARIQTARNTSRSLREPASPPRLPAIAPTAVHTGDSNTFFSRSSRSSTPNPSLSAKW